MLFRTLLIVVVLAVAGCASNPITIPQPPPVKYAP